MINKTKSIVVDSKLYSAGANLASHPFFAGSAIMIIGSNIANFVAYIYHLIVGRMLGPAEYGDLVAFISIVGIVTVTFNFLGLVIVKYSSSLEENESYSFLRWLNSKAFYGGIIGSIILVFVTPYISNFLHIDNNIVIFLSPLFFLYLMSFVYRSFLQGKLRFKEVVLSINLDMGGRLVFGVILIILGLSVVGAVIGNVIATFLAFILVYIFTKNYLHRGVTTAFNKKRDVFKYSIPVLVSAVSSYMMITSDVLIVKHFYPAREAGLYAAISTLGKIIFYGTGPISAVMFPFVSKRHSKGYGYNKIIFCSLLLTLGIGVAVTFVYYLFPELMINILYGEEFVSAAPNLYKMGIFLSIFALASLLLNYFISIEKTKVVYFAVITLLLQLIGLYFYSQSIVQVINISITAVSLLFVILILYLIYDYNKNRSILNKSS